MDKALKFHNAYIYSNADELERLWMEEAPTTLIKFFPAKYEQNGDNYFLNHLRQGTLWLSSPSKFNDPFDSVINFDSNAQIDIWETEIVNSLVGEATAREILKSGIEKERMENLKSQFQIEIEEIHKRFERGIYATCFSERQNLISLRMWGHYANNHAGICAEYAFEDVNNATPFGCIPIRYVDSYEYLICPQNISESTKNILKIYAKSSEWEYEKEWRICQIRERFSGKGYNISFVKPKRIFLGCNANERLEKDVTEICENTAIELFKMVPRKGSFLLDTVQIV